MVLLYLPNPLHLRRRRGVTTEVTEFFFILIALLGVLLLTVEPSIFSSWRLIPYSVFPSIHQCNCHDFPSSQNMTSAELRAKTP